MRILQLKKGSLCFTVSKAKQSYYYVSADYNGKTVYVKSFVNGECKLTDSITKARFYPEDIATKMAEMLSYGSQYLYGKRITLVLYIRSAKAVKQSTLNSWGRSRYGGYYATVWEEYAKGKGGEFVNYSADTRGKLRMRLREIGIHQIENNKRVDSI